MDPIADVSAVAGGDVTALARGGDVMALPLSKVEAGSALLDSAEAPDMKEKPPATGAAAATGAEPPIIKPCSIPAGAISTLLS